MTIEVEPWEIKGFITNDPLEGDKLVKPVQVFAQLFDSNLDVRLYVDKIEVASVMIEVSNPGGNSDDTSNTFVRAFIWRHEDMDNEPYAKVKLFDLKDDPKVEDKDGD